jgi:N-acetylneuraminic acid mutarotase
LKNIRRIIFLFPLVFIVSCIVITGVYTEVRSNPETLLTPVGRFGHAMVFDPIRKCTILFGGTADNSLSRLLNDTWIYNYSDNTWKRINPTNCPPARMNHGMVYDSINQKVILFGGDTWIFDSQNEEWSKLDPETQPPSASDRAMYYDPINQKIIQFGGFRNVGGHMDETWAYDHENNSWLNLKPSFKPDGRYGPTLVYDPINQRGLLFGGRVIGVVNDIWAFYHTNNSWVELHPIDSPPRRYWHTMVYDSVNEKSIIFGGYGNYPEIFNDTWSYDVSSNVWTELDVKTKPNNRVGHAMTYDSINQKVIMFGGAGLDLDNPYNDTWVYDYTRNTWTNMDSLKEEKKDSIPGYGFVFTLGALSCTIFIVNKKKDN